MRTASVLVAKEHDLTSDTKSGSTLWGDSVLVLQRCTHLHVYACIIVNIHAGQRVMTCVTPASFLRFAMSDILPDTAWRTHVLTASNAGMSDVTFWTGHGVVGASAVK